MEDNNTPYIQPCNPYRRPLLKFVEDIKGIAWEFPYVPQLVECLVLLIVFVITGVLFLTVGVAAQLASIFQGLLIDAKKQIVQGTLIEKSAYAVAAGIYILLWLPLFLLLLPFLMVGWIWDHFGYCGLVIIVMLIIAFCITYVYSGMAEYIIEQCLLFNGDSTIAPSP